MLFVDVIEEKGKKWRFRKKKKNFLLLLFLSILIKESDRKLKFFLHQTLLWKSNNKWKVTLCTRIWSYVCFCIVLFLFPCSCLALKFLFLLIFCYEIWISSVWRRIRRRSRNKKPLVFSWLKNFRRKRKNWNDIVHLNSFSCVGTEGISSSRLARRKINIKFSERELEQFGTFMHSFFFFKLLSWKFLMFI